uniref:KAT8 regulatory NSL complex subunit 2 n=1 Tax=Micromonas pusilla TaxID=38833 RepID=A0A7S0IF37_MICPS|mmetsp:Transcript_4568/g.18824  ORF Transcript_4568/g.18824 Transcript_4568/m.18824 type:complete len:213 (+) Transcript_4568:120-758(+)
MKRDEAEDDDGELGRAARRARTESDGRLAAAVELAIDTDDDVDAAETDGATDEADAERDEDDGRVVPQEALIRRRIRRMKELKRLYQDQYWRLLEDLRRKHYRFQLRNGHGGRKDEAAAAAQEREKAGMAAQCACDDCDAKPVPLSAYCFAHILMDAEQVLYAAPKPEGAAGDGDAKDGGGDGKSAPGDGAGKGEAKKAREEEDAPPAVLAT